MSGNCPSCESVGPIGTPCTERICTRHGVVRIPAEFARKALAENAAKREPLVGQLIGDYLIVERLGKGGFGKVLLGLQRPLYRLKAAVKVVEFTGSDERVHARTAAKFEGEAAALAVLQSPHIVRLLQYGVHQGLPFMAMEFIPGSRTLQTEISRMIVGHEALEREVIKHILDQTLNGLEAAHAEHIIHRDIKPENIMLQEVVGDPWFVKLVDFGLAKVVAESRETSLVLGTVHYMAPEQIEAKNLGPWTDLYALGVIAYELLIGHRPFVGKDTQLILREKLNPTFDPIARCAHLDFPEVVPAFLRRALHRSPEKRYRSSQEFRAAWAGLFEATSGSTMFSTDLSGLVESGDLLEIKKMESALVRQREQLEAERKLLEYERKKLASERVKVTSGSVGPESESPVALESWAIGQTRVLNGSPVAATEALSVLENPVTTTEAVIRTEFVSEPALGPDMETGVPNRRESSGTPGSGVRFVWMLVALAIAGAGIALALILRPGGAAEATLSAESVQLARPSSPADTPAAAVPKTLAAAELESSRAHPAEPSARVEPTVVLADEVAKPSIPSAAADVVGPSDALAIDGRATAETVRVSITSTPPGAKVRVDAVERGLTPFELETTIGARHRVEVTRGAQAEVREIEVVSDRDALSVRFKPQAVRRLSTVSGAEEPKAPRPTDTPPQADAPNRPATKPLFVD